MKELIYHFLVLLAPALGVQALDPTVDGAIGLLQGSSDTQGPWAVPISEFNSLVNDHPNATGNYPIEGFNISAPYPDAESLDGWSWSISVAADIPAENLFNEFRGKYYTGGRITLKAPDSLLNAGNRSELAVHSDWKMCVIWWSLSNVAYPDALRHDDGSCTSVLSAECVADMEREAIQDYCTCPSPDDVPSCGGDDGAVVWRNNSCVAMPLGGEAIRERFNGGELELLAYGDTTAHEPGNVTAYNFMGSVAWPTLVYFSRNSSGVVDKTGSRLTCVRTNRGVGGSLEPDGDHVREESGGSVLYGDVSVVLLGLAGSLVVFSLA